MHWPLLVTSSVPVLRSPRAPLVLLGSSWSLLLMASVPVLRSPQPLLDGLRRVVLSCLATAVTSDLRSPAPVCVVRARRRRSSVLLGLRWARCRSMSKLTSRDRVSADSPLSPDSAGRGTARWYWSRLVRASAPVHHSARTQLSLMRRDGTGHIS